MVEAGTETGGLLQRGRVAGVDLDLGAEAFATRTTGVTDLIADAALDLTVVDPGPDGAHLVHPRRFRRVGRAPLPRRAVIGMPADPAADDVRRIIGRAGVRRALAERSIPTGGGGEPSLAELVTARFGPRVAERLVDPLCRSVYSQAPASVRLSTLHPALWSRFQELGSLTAAVDALAPAARAGSAVRGVEGGLWRLPEALRAAAERAGARIRTGTPVRALRRAGAHHDVVLDGAVLAAREVVVATGPRAAARLLGAVEPDTAPIRLATVELALPALAARPVGTGAIVAPGVPLRAKALTHVDAKWAWAAAALPAGTHVVRLSARDGARPGFDDPRTLAREIRLLTGIRVPESAVRSVTPVAWTDAVVPTSARTELAAAAGALGVHLAGAVAAGTGLASVVPHARALARDLVATPAPARPTPSRSEGAPHVR